MNSDAMHTEHAGEHVEGTTKQGQEESRKSSNMGMFTPDSEGSPTTLHENHGDRNK